MRSSIPSGPSACGELPRGSVGPQRRRLRPRSRRPPTTNPTSSTSIEEWRLTLCPMMSRPYWRKSPHNVMPIAIGTIGKTSDDTMPLGNRIRLSLFPGMRHPRMKKPLGIGSSVCRGMFGGASIRRPKNMVASWQGTTHDPCAIIRPSLATCSLSSSGQSKPLSQVKGALSLRVSCHQRTKGKGTGTFSPERPTISFH